MTDARRFFDAIAGRYDRAYAPDARTSRAKMDRVLAELPARARVLDLGLGTGRELSALQDAGHDPVGLDVSQEMLDRCDRRARRIELVLADFWDALPFPDASFDAVLALHGTLAHPPKDDAPRALARELARVVRGGGVLVAELPSHAWLERLSAAGGAEDRFAWRDGANGCVYEDRVAGVRIDAWIPDDGAWRALLEAEGWTACVEPRGDAEILVVARRP